MDHDLKHHVNGPLDDAGAQISARCGTHALESHGLHLSCVCDRLFDGKPQVQHQAGHEGLHMFKKR